MSAITEMRILLGESADVVLENHTSSDTLTKDENGSVHTNYGATGAISLTLPSDAEVDHVFHFKVAAAYALNVVVGAASQSIIANGTTYTDDGGGDMYIGADDEGEYLDLTLISSGVWLATLINGTWTKTQP